MLLLLKWSSPATAITPPNSVVPAMFACLNTSDVRSTPGPLPYQMPNTPSNLLVPGGEKPSCCVPHNAVAANSSFTPGWNTMFCAFRYFAAFPQRLVVAAERRAAVAADEAGRVLAGL